MKLGIVIYSNDPETVWNAFRLGVFSLKQGDAVSVFLLGKGVESGSLATEKFDAIGQMRNFVEKVMQFQYFCWTKVWNLDR